MDMTRNTTRDMTSIPKRAKRSPSLMVTKSTTMADTDSDMESMDHMTSMDMTRNTTRDMTSIPKRAKRSPSLMVTKSTTMADTDSDMERDILYPKRAERPTRSVAYTEADTDMESMDHTITRDTTKDMTSIPK